MPNRGHKAVMTYEFYRRVPNWEDEDRFIGLLLERRKDTQRITYQSIMNLAKLLAPEDDVLRRGSLHGPKAREMEEHIHGHTVRSPLP
jgi:hypothetical protein